MAWVGLELRSRRREACILPLDQENGWNKYKPSEIQVSNFEKGKHAMPGIPDTGTNDWRMRDRFDKRILIITEYDTYCLSANQNWPKLLPPEYDFP